AVRTESIRAVDRRPVGGVERVVVADPLLAAPRSAGHLELHGVVIHAVRAVGLHAAVAMEVVSEADARPDLGSPVEGDARGVRVIRRNLLMLQTETVVE